MTELHEYRDRFPILSDTTYLINHSLGRDAGGGRRRLLRVRDAWATRGVRAWARAGGTSRRVGDQVGRIIGAPPGTTVMHQNVTLAEAVVLSCFDFGPPRNRIVFEEASSRPCATCSRRSAAAPRSSSADDDGRDRRDRRAHAARPDLHVLFKTGEIQEVAPIVRRAHEAGAYVCLDAYQSAGIVPLDVTELGVDFAVGGSVKWLCGGPGAGWLYVRPDLAERLEPTLVGWKAHARPFAFEPELEYADGGAPLPDRHAERPRPVRRDRRLRPDRGDRRRPDPRAARSPDAAPGRPLRRGRARGRLAARPRAAGRLGRRLAPDFEARATPSSASARSSATSARTSASGFGPHFFNTDDELRFAVVAGLEILEPRRVRASWTGAGRRLLTAPSAAPGAREEPRARPLHRPQATGESPLANVASHRRHGFCRRMPPFLRSPDRPARPIRARLGGSDLPAVARPVPRRDAASRVGGRHELRAGRSTSRRRRSARPRGGSRRTPAGAALRGELAQVVVGRTAARAGGRNGTARPRGRSPDDALDARPTTRGGSRIASSSPGRPSRARRTSSPSSRAALDHDADRPEPVAERCDPLDERRHPVEPAERHLEREPEPVRHRLAHRLNCSSDGSRYPVVFSSTVSKRSA